MQLKMSLAASVCAVALVIGAAGSAQATPYAYASNSISGLTIVNADNTAISPTTATTSISDSAIYDGFPGDVHQARGIVGNASSVPQAYSGPGPAPSATYTPQAVGSFTGARSDAAIGAGSASSGGVSVMNVAEGYGNAFGNSNATNDAAVSFTVTGTGQALKVSFSDLYQMIASTAALTGESATSSISNTFSITAAGSNTPLFSFGPADINAQISSVAGTPSRNNVGPTTFTTSFSTPMLTAGQTYNISLTSTATETIQPGTATPVPEPASLALLGAGLFAVGMIRRKAMHR